MALEVDKQIHLNAFSVINGSNVMTLSANIPNDTAVANVSQYVQNTELYDAHKTEVRKDVEDFRLLVYEIEDELSATE